jgi:hypothetical protein
MISSVLNKYEIHGFVFSSQLPIELINIIKKFECDIRLSQDESIWLLSQGTKFLTYKVKHKFHRLEANYYIQEYTENSENLWNVFNASSHLRKCEASLEAESLLNSIRTSDITDKTLLSAYFTTLGGTQRDLGKSRIAIRHASHAHELTPEDYRPCTLLGALHIETHQYELGHEWYRKASERGAPQNSINNELKKIISKLPRAKQKELVNSLLDLDSGTYWWLKAHKNIKKNSQNSQNS